MELKKNLVEKPEQNRLDQLKRYQNCLFLYSCFYLPNSLICKKLIGGR